MEHVLGKIRHVPSVQIEGQDEIIAQWEIGDPIDRKDVRFVLDITTLRKLNEAMEESNCGIICLGGLTWRIQLRKSKEGHNYGVVKFGSYEPKPMSFKS